MTNTILKVVATVALTGSLALGELVPPNQSDLAAVQGSALTDTEQEQFLLSAKETRRKGIGVGVNGTLRLTLTDGELTHDAHFNGVNISEPIYKTSKFTEVNFKDCYRYNVAAYRLDRMIGLNMVPVTVERSLGGQTGSVAWWVDVMMMERERYENNIRPPDPRSWNNQMYQVRVFNELVYNTDANLGNLLITPDWDIRLVDFTRAFRLHEDLKSPENLRRIDRRIYEGLKALTEEGLREEMDGYLMRGEIRSLLARRDKIIEFFDRQIEEEGEAAVICDQPGH